VLVKQGQLNGSWTSQYAKASNLAVATDPASGPLIAVLTGTGQALVKQGSLDAPWIAEHTGPARVNLSG